MSLKKLNIDVNSINEYTLSPKFDKNTKKICSYENLQKYLSSVNGVLSPTNLYYQDYRQRMLKLVEELDDKKPFTEEMTRFFFRNRDNQNCINFDCEQLISENEMEESNILISESENESYYESDYSYYDNLENESSDESEYNIMNSSFNSENSYI